MVYANENTPLGQATHADTVYLTGASGTDVGNDQDDRVTLSTTAHTGVDNADLALEGAGGLESVTVANRVINAQVYDGLNIVAETEPTVFSTAVKTAFDADNLFNKGNFLGTDYTDEKELFDPTYLVEASKMTGEKYF